MHRRWLMGILVSLVALAGCSSTPQPSPTAAPTRAQVQAFVEQAVAYADANGKKAALEAFSTPGGQFHQGELYIFAYDFDGTVIAHGGDAGLIGRNLIDMTDPNGVKVIEELAERARNGSGWLEYTWPNPQNSDADELKLGYVQKVNDEWFLGSGAYIE